MEEKVVGRGSAGRVPGQAGEDELLGCGEERRMVDGKIFALEEIPEDPRPHESNHRVLPPQ